MNSTVVEMRVGMSSYWVKLTPEANGWSAEWKQLDRPRQVWSAGTKREALAEAKRIAAELNAQLAVMR